MRFKQFHRIIVLLFCVASFTINAQNNKVSIEADTLAIRIGEQINITINVNELNRVVFPKFKVDSLTKVEVVKTLPTDTLKNKLSKKYILTSFDSGSYIIPQQEVFINKQKYVTDSLLIQVTTVAVDTTKQKMFPIKAVKKEPKTFDDYKHLIWWILLLLALIAMVLYYIFRKKETKPIPKIYVAPITEAMQRLKALDEKQLIAQHKTKAYYSELTNIVRTYIEKDIKIPALESTSGELMETMRDFNESSNLGISLETLNNLESVLQNADFVKFAKATPLSETIQTDRKLIEVVLQNMQSNLHKADNNLENIEATSTVKPTEKKKLSFPYKRTPKNWNNKAIAIALVILVVITIAIYFIAKKITNNESEKTLPELNKTTAMVYVTNNIKANTNLITNNS